jgi:hypothetical protein
MNNSTPRPSPTKITDYEFIVGIGKLYEHVHEGWYC